MANSPAPDVVWYEQRTLLFDQILAFLQSHIKDQQDGLALVAMALLFGDIGDKRNCDLTLDTAEDTLRSLPPVSDSGWALRDCLLASTYLFAAKRVGRDTTSVEHLIFPRIRYAAANAWFGDSALASAVALIADEVQAGSQAHQYLSTHLTEWLDGDALEPVLHYALVAHDEHVARVGQHLSARDWSSSDLATLSLALLALRALAHKGYEDRATEWQLRSRVLTMLGATLVPNTWDTSQQPDDDTHTRPPPAMDVALAGLSIRLAGFDSIIGVPRTQKNALQTLLRLKSQLVHGGVLVTRWEALAGNLSFAALFGLLVAYLLHAAGRQSTLEFIAGCLAPPLVAVVRALIRGRSPLWAALETFGPIRRIHPENGKE